MTIKSKGYPPFPGHGEGRLWLAALVLALLAVVPTPAHANSENFINLYSYRSAVLMEPLLQRFTAATAIEVNVVYAKSGLLQRLKAEGLNSPADAVLAADITRIDEMAKAGLLSAVRSDILEANIPAAYRHPEGLWVGLTSRARVIYAHKTRVKPGEIKTYEDLASPAFRNRVCIRSGKHEYNITLLASMINALGTEQAETWLRGLKNNLSRRPQGNDRAQVRAIYEGECDVSVGNSYYYGRMATNEKNPEQKDWAAAVNIIFPNQPGSGDGKDAVTERGTHVNISAGAITKSAKHKQAATRLLEFLSGDEAQEIYAAQNLEYPLKKGAPLHPLVQSWGAFKADSANLADIARLQVDAARMMDRVGFDH